MEYLTPREVALALKVPETIIRKLFDKWGPVFKRCKRPIPRGQESR